jgi:putative SOS response-associated peptidase YedK
MCGRFALKATTKDIEKLLPQLESNIEITDSFNISPSQNIAIVRNNINLTFDFAIWGLIPSWAKDRAISQKLFNARSETIDEKSSFKNSFKSKRCLIPATAFYEWRKSSSVNSKQAYRFSLKNEPIFFFAGLWDIWASQDNESVLSATILTTSANSLVSEIHKRMPVIISSKNQQMWLDNSTDSSTLKSMLSPINANLMIADELESNFFLQNKNAVLELFNQL